MFPRPPKILVGRLVQLGQVKESYARTFLNWIHDPAVTCTLASRRWPKTIVEERTWLREKRRDPKTVMFAIHHPQSERLIGTTELRINRTDRHAEFAIMIGERFELGKGFGKEATKLMLRYAFEHRKLHSVYLTVMSTNVAGIRAYRRAGFRQVGRWREVRRWGNRYIDVYLMDILAPEWRRQRKQKQ